MKRYLIAALIVLACSAGGLRADDTEIYGVINNTSVAPNVLIIFDTSGSMAETIPGDPYDPGTTYAGSYSTNAVYQQYWNGHRYVWQLFASDVNNLACDSIKSALLADGYTSGKIRASTFACGGTKLTLRLGNFCNYDDSGIGAPTPKIDVAKIDSERSHNKHRRRALRPDGVQPKRYRCPQRRSSGGALRGQAGHGEQKLASYGSGQRQCERLYAAGRDPGRSRALFRRQAELVQHERVSDRDLYRGPLRFPHAVSLPEELHHPHDRRSAYQ